jgi:homoaconitate hydratase
MRGQNLVEKIAQKYAVGLGKGSRVKSGAFISIKPHHVMTHDNTAAVLQKFNQLPVKGVCHNTQPVYAMDHNIQDTSEKNLKKYQTIKQFAERNKVDYYPPGRGIGHQVMIEEGYAFPQTMTVASDSHSNMYGGIGCLGTPLVRTDAASIWATGTTWWKVPPVVKVELTGALPAFRTGKDVIIALCGLFDNDEVLNCAIEFGGAGVKSLSVDDRLAIANMTTEWGALAGLFPVDDLTFEWLERRSKKLEHDFKRNGKFNNNETVPTLKNTSKHPRYNNYTISNLRNNLLKADGDAFYSKILHIDLSSLGDSFVSGPNSVKLATPVSKLQEQKIKVHKAYLVSCVNSRLSDIKQAADVIREESTKVGKPVKFDPSCKVYVAAASSEVQKESSDNGDWQVLMDAGAHPLPPGCGPCIGLGAGLLEDNEVGISSTNRNFKGRMGSKLAQCYLASPSVVMSSALNGYICAPSATSASGSLLPQKSIEVSDNEEKEYSEEVNVVPGFPSVLNGEALYCPQNGLNTDVIYPGKYTYKDDLTPSEMAKVAMENYDPKFTSIVKQGDILVTGSNFGTGSSREQAATALKYAGVRLILGKSFSETFMRNSLNNGLICLECPSFVNDLDQFLGGRKNLTNRTGVNLKMDLTKGVMEAEFKGSARKTYRLSQLGQIAQELVAYDGLEKWVEAKLNQ